ncbi:hypothetical protein PV327_004902 [Microctonus hyperodae]|uniref:Potassium channel domain-containing protein n=1 Tax=Microctonus hyperodae TaxID=165561 RepID=A0AA39KN13_MICHY|nr:hypothetical protein PV327_004902 [Microctonus hyperodae]
MNVPRFPAPPSPLDRPSSTAIKTITNEIFLSPDDDCLPNDNECDQSNDNLSATKKRVYRLARLGNSTVHPRRVSKKELKAHNHSSRIIEITLKMTERRVEDDDDDDDVDVVCAASASVLPDLSETVDPIIISEETMNSELSNKDQFNHHIASMPIHHPIINKASIGVQTHQYERLYMLKVLPTLKDIAEEDTNDNAKISSRICRNFRFIGRLCLCQFGLAWILTFWTVAGAAAFYATEGPREREQVFELKGMQRDLAVGLATELRQIKSSEEDIEPLWSDKVKYYVEKHEKQLLAAVNAGYGEGGETPGGQLWTFSGCVLFTISLITTLGFGAPVPRTTSGRLVAVIFAAIGIPAHFLLIFNLSLLLAVRLQRFAIRKKYGSDCDIETLQHEPVPRWSSFSSTVTYYSIGIIGFGAGRSRPLAASVLFPLDFTAAGGLATTSSAVRIIYGLYLEGAVTIAAITIAVLRVSASESLTNIGLKYNLLIPV